MTIKSRLEKVYPDYELVTYSKMSKSILSDCPECGKDRLELEHKHYPDPDSWVECMACGSKFDFRVDTNMWIKKREE